MHTVHEVPITPEERNIGALMSIYVMKQFGVTFNMVCQIGIVTTDKYKYKWH